MWEVQLTAQKADDNETGPAQSAISVVRRKMLQAIRVEEDKSWEDLWNYDMMVCIHSLLRPVLDRCKTPEVRHQRCTYADIEEVRHKKCCVMEEASETHIYFLCI